VHWWLKPVILATQKAEIRPILKKKIHLGMVAHSCNPRETLSPHWSVKQGGQDE
jgi:hypothetical protein